MSILEKVEPTLLRVVNAISTVVGADVVIVDENARIVVSSEGYLERKKSSTWKPYIDFVIKSGKKTVIDNPGFHKLCAGCSKEKQCPQTLEIIAPLSFDGSVIGYISLISFSNEQRNEFLKRKQDILEFLDQMGQLIIHAVAETEISEKLNKTSLQLNATINSIDQGILTCRADGIVTHCNIAAQLLLRLGNQEIIGQPITKILPGCPTITNVLTEKRNSLEQEWRIKVRGQWQHLVTSGHLILDSYGIVNGAVIIIRDAKEVHRLINSISGQDAVDYTLDDIIGLSDEIKTIKSRIASIAPSNSTVLIRGESGTGKELVARVIHSLSPRRNGPFTAINCCAIPDTLLESELFGYEGGAFTGAKRGGKAGKFELANGGTLFLDEIGDMPLHLQAKLLRVLQERVVERIGTNHSIPLDVRIIAATNQDLEEKVKNGEFREDLFYRINVIPLVIPPLRERRSDILPLCFYFIDKFNRIFGKTVRGVEDDFEKAILEYNWPGNVRELENAIEYAMNFERGQQLSAESLPQRIQKARSCVREQSDYLLDAHIKNLERDLILQALKKYGYSAEGKLEAARALGISRATFYRKAKELGIRVS